LNAAIDEGLAMSHDDYRSALVRRAALAEFALDLFEDCDALASLRRPARPGAARRHGRSELLHALDAPGFRPLRCLPVFPTAACPTECSSPVLRRRRSALARRKLVRSGDRFQPFSRMNCGNAFGAGLAAGGD